ncbi:hypothetical protein EVAR_35586_1 [Eumeta japonica]|uniref:Uncharacterized protein n=1 Tax=Eumeta variegata TaxID=151549 RepID=A0A4C1XPM1_EUMVA|nr:hypothetical protein EVAR_35586_1 [Eumeta japonica]
MFNPHWANVDGLRPTPPIRKIVGAHDSVVNLQQFYDTAVEPSCDQLGCKHENGSAQPVQHHTLTGYGREVAASYRESEGSGGTLPPPPLNPFGNPFPLMDTLNPPKRSATRECPRAAVTIYCLTASLRVEDGPPN